MGQLTDASVVLRFGYQAIRRAGLPTEEILTKAKKLHSWQLKAISERLKICKAAVKIHLLENKIKGQSMTQSQFDETYKKRIEELRKRDPFIYK